jgi:hypothetical protein
MNALLARILDAHVGMLEVMDALRKNKAPVVPA